MSTNDAATLVIGSGNFLLATYSAQAVEALPTDLRAPGSNWKSVGHTSVSDIFSVNSEGGDATTLGTLQNRSLRTSYSKRTETFKFNLQQFDTDGLKLYYGANATIGSAGEIQVPTNPTPTVSTFMVVFVDGNNSFAFYVPKAEIFRADDVSLADTESLGSLPIAVKPLVHGSNDWTYAVTPLGV